MTHIHTPKPIPHEKHATKCQRCGFEMNYEPDQESGTVLKYLLIILFSTGFVAIGCLILGYA